MGAVVATRRHTQHAPFTCASPISNSSQKLSEATISNLSVRILFPSRTGRTLLKADVVNAYRAVVAEAGIQTTEIDGTGRVRQRIGGHLCRVVGAVWLYSTLRELYLVQLFARWGFQATARYVQDSHFQRQAEFVAHALQAFFL